MKYCLNYTKSLNFQQNDYFLKDIFQVTLAHEIQNINNE